MADNEVPKQDGIQSQKTPLDTPENPSDSPIGVFAPFPYSPEPFAELSEKAQGALMQLDITITKSDIAARRMEVEQAWESLHFDRGYQHLLRGKNGGWELPSATTGYGAKQQVVNHGIYDTNVYGAKGDIIVAALSREIPKQEFFPSNPEYAPDIMAAEEANNFKSIWARNNNLHALLVDCARIFWNEDRVLLWTRYELDGQKYGFEEEESTPTVPEDLMTPPGPEPTGQTELENVEAAETSPIEDNGSDLGSEIESVLAAATGEPETAGGSPSQRKPLGREVTTAHGKLDHKVPISVDKLCEMGWVKLYVDPDVAIAKAMFPWISGKIKPGGDGTSDSELDRIARENTRQAVLGAFVTGDSMQRKTVCSYTWFRPSMFMDEKVEDDVRAELFEKFPNGCVLAKAGENYAFSRNESMDEHLAIGHPISGKGQNRRSMGASLISIQKRINDWVDLLDDFFKRTVPKKWMNADAFNLDAMKNQPNMPGSTGPFEPIPGLTTADQYIMVEPTPQPQTSLPDFIKWFVTNLSEEISGALPSLFGAATGEETVGNAQIQRDQALQRIGCPWNNIQDMFAEAALQAVICAKNCRDGKKMSQNIPGKGLVEVNTINLTKGTVLCFPESNPSFPESWAQREAKMMQMVDVSTANPAVAQWLFSPENLPFLADAIRLKDFTVPGASSVTKQKSEFELLLRAGPMPNPKVVEASQALEKAKAGMMQATQAGEEVPPQAAGMVDQLEQAIKGLPQEVSTVPVAQDASELHQVEGTECFKWMNSAEGQKFKYGTPEQKAGFANVYLHWKEHDAMAKQIAAENAPPQKPPSESLSAAVDKLPQSAAIQALAKMNIKVTPEDFEQHAKEQVQVAVQKKAIPEALKQGA